MQYSHSAEGNDSLSAHLLPSLPPRQPALFLVYLSVDFDANTVNTHSPTTNLLF